MVKEAAHTDTFDFELTGEQMARIAALDEGRFLAGDQHLLGLAAPRPSVITPAALVATLEELRD